MSEQALALETEREQGARMLEQARLALIETDQDMELAAVSLKTVKDLRKGIEEKFASPIKHADKAHKELIALRNEIDKPYLMAENMLRQKSGLYLQDQQRKRDEEIRRREAEARALAEAEREKEREALRISQELEAKQRRAELAEAKRKGDERAAAELKARNEREALEARREQARLAATPLAVMVPEPVPEAATFKGISQPKRWGWKTARPELIPEQYWIVDEKAVTAIVSKLGQDAARLIPGIEVFQQTGIAVR